MSEWAWLGMCVSRNGTDGCVCVRGTAWMLIQSPCWSSEALVIPSMGESIQACTSDRPLPPRPQGRAGVCLSLQPLKHLAAVHSVLRLSAYTVFLFFFWPFVLSVFIEADFLCSSLSQEYPCPRGQSGSALLALKGKDESQQEPPPLTQKGGRPSHGTVCRQQ